MENTEPIYTEPQNTLEKWRLMLGGGAADGTDCQLPAYLTQIDESLTVLYEFDKTGKFEYGETKGKGGQGGSNPGIARWLGDIRKYFPQSVVNVIQNDALKFPELQRKMIFEPEILESTQADIHLVVNLMELGKLIPSKTKETARKVVQKVVDELILKLEQKTISAISGAIDKSARNRRLRYNEINWSATIRKNLRHYIPEYKTIIPENKIGYGRKAKHLLKDVILCIDQSGSMGTSVVYSGIFGAVMASIPNVKTKMVVFDTQVADLTEDLKDPVDLLFGVQLGGGTDINRALAYCQELIIKPDDTILLLITDLYEGGNEKEMLQRVKDIAHSGVQMICLLALNDDGCPSYDHSNAKELANLNVPVFACTPDLFPELMAAAIKKLDIKEWAGNHDMVMK
ncbi:MAG: VWA domain-containing protein [Chitinophagales bacterium]|nr:VWA domain-containing protein [Bacteroidota bacterium]MCB9043450.1 VWA domain-containing protein [Chitinophagales bacterium]